MAAEQHSTTISDVINLMFTTTQEKIGAALATGAILLPAWHPTLKDASETAGLAAPILGCIWLSVQIVAKIGEIVYRRRRADRES